MSEERLERLERIIEATLSLTQQSREDLIQTDQMTKRNAIAIAQLEEKINQYVEQSIRDRETFTSEIRGLRTEMQRLLAEVLGGNQKLAATSQKNQALRQTTPTSYNLGPS